MAGVVYMTGASRGKEHLDAHNDQHRHHGDQAGHGRVAMIPERRKAWVGERHKGRWQQMDERRRDEDSRSKMPREEQEVTRYREIWKTSNQDRKGTC